MSRFPLRHEIDTHKKRHDVRLHRELERKECHRDWSRNARVAGDDMGGGFFASQAREALVPRAVKGEESGPAAADMDV